MNVKFVFKNIFHCIECFTLFSFQDSLSLALKYIKKYSINIPLWNENHVDGSGDFLHTNFG